MTENTAVLRIECGQNYILFNKKFALICKLCGSDFFTLDDFRTHLSEHFPGASNNIKTEESISCNSECVTEHISII